MRPSNPLEESKKVLRSEIEAFVQSVGGRFGVNLKNPMHKHVFDAACNTILDSPEADTFLAAAISKPPVSVELAKETVIEGASSFGDSLIAKLNARLAQLGKE